MSCGETPDSSLPVQCGRWDQAIKSSKKEEVPSCKRVSFSFFISGDVLAIFKKEPELNEATYTRVSLLAMFAFPENPLVIDDDSPD